MAYTHSKFPDRWLRVAGAGLTSSLLALGPALAQQAPATTASDATAQAPAAAAAPAETAASSAETAAAPADTAAQTQGQRAAAEAAARLAAGEDDEPVILEAPDVDAHRVYVQDPAHFAAITQQYVIDGAEGRVIGMTDGGFLPNPFVADDGSFFGQASTVYSRVARGKRTDYIEIFDSKTFLPTADIELPEAARFLVGTYPWLTSLQPDNSDLLFYQFSPAPAVGVVDLEAKAFDRFLEVPDCYHMFPVGNDTFYMHCRDGSLAKVNYAGGETTVTQTEVFHAEDEYLINHPAYSVKAQRLVWPSYTGRIHVVDFSSGEAVFREPIEALTEAELADNWRPGGWQQVAYHRGKNRIYLLVDQRDQWRHKTASRFLLVIDADSGERISKVELGHGIDSINVSQDDAALLYGLSTGDKTLYIYDEETGKELRSVNQLGHGPQVLTVHDLGA